MAPELVAESRLPLTCPMDHTSDIKWNYCSPAGPIIGVHSLQSTPIQPIIITGNWWGIPHSSSGSVVVLIVRCVEGRLCYAEWGIGWRRNHSAIHEETFAATETKRDVVMRKIAFFSCDLLWYEYASNLSFADLTNSVNFPGVRIFTFESQLCGACLYASQPLLRSSWVVKYGMLSRLVGPDTGILWGLQSWSCMSHRAFN